MQISGQKLLEELKVQTSKLYILYSFKLLYREISERNLILKTISESLSTFLFKKNTDTTVTNTLQGYNLSTLSKSNISHNIIQYAPVQRHIPHEYSPITKLLFHELF